MPLSRDVKHEYGIDLRPEAEGKYDAIIVAVGHREYKDLEYIKSLHIETENPLIFDIKGIFPYH